MITRVCGSCRLIQEAGAERCPNCGQPLLPPDGPAQSIQGSGLGGQAAEVRRFTRLAQAVDFIAACCEQAGAESLAAQVINFQNLDPAKDFSLSSFYTYVFGRLRERHAVASLRELYRGREFPEDETALKLGGHAKELGHIHIDFVRLADGWSLKSITMCR
jgi:hypothetical protein